MSGQRYLIFLVHGTWAGNTPWMQPGSRFRTLVTESLEADDAENVEFVNCGWSGDNTHEARADASERLRALIAEHIAERSDWDAFVVAHSHGGNIALHALLRSRLLREKLSGMVTIATPFLSFDERPPVIIFGHSTLKAMMRFTLVVTAYWLILLLATTLAHFLTPLVEWQFAIRSFVRSAGHGACSALGSPQACSDIATLIGATWVFIFGSGWMVGLLVTSFDTARTLEGDTVAALRQEVQAHYFYSQPRADLEDFRILSLSATADQASLALACSRWLHRIPQLLAAGFTFLIIAAALAGAVATLIYLDRLQRTTSLSNDEILNFVMYIFSIMVALPLAFSTVVAIGLALSTVYFPATPSLGLRTRRGNLIWSVRASRTLQPAPAYRHRHFGWRELLRGGSSGWPHSRLYSNSIALDAIAEWMRENARSGHS